MFGLPGVIKGLKDILDYLRGGRLYDTGWYEIPGIAAADALDANDAIGTMFKIKVPGAGRIMSMKLVDPDDDTLALTMHIYTSAVVGAASDAAYTVNKAFATAWLSNVTFGAGTDEGGFKASEVLDADIDYVTYDGYLYVVCSTTGTPTVAAASFPQTRWYVLPY